MIAEYGTGGENRTYGPLLSHVIMETTGHPLHDLRIKERPALSHQSNRLFDIWTTNDRLIAKEFIQPDEQAEAPRREYRALQLLSGLDIAPQPLFYKWILTMSLPV